MRIDPPKVGKVYHGFAGQGTGTAETMIGVAREVGLRMRILFYQHGRAASEKS